MTRQHDRAYTPVPDHYAGARCPRCVHFRVQHGVMVGQPESKPGCWWTVLGCPCDWVPEEEPCATTTPT
jgi:hypothetical protein